MAQSEIEHLKQYEATQNGCARRIEDRLNVFIEATFPSAMTTLREDLFREIGKAKDKSSSTTCWLYRAAITALAGTVTGLAVFIATH